MKKLLLILDWLGQDDMELFEVSGAAYDVVKNFDGQYANSTDSSDEFDKWFNEVLHDKDTSERNRSLPDYKKLEGDEPCGPFDRIVVCGMIP